VKRNGTKVFLLWIEIDRVGIGSLDWAVYIGLEFGNSRIEILYNTCSLPLVPKLGTSITFGFT
jgi:hypothetical protein